MLDIAGLVSFVEDGGASQLYRTCSPGGFSGAPVCGGVTLLIAPNDGRAGCCCVTGGAGGIFTAFAAPLPVVGKKFDEGCGTSAVVLVGSVAVTGAWPVEIGGENNGFADPKLSLAAGMFVSLFEAGCINGDDVSGALVLEGKNEGPADTEAGGSVTPTFGANNDVVCVGTAPCERNENAPEDWVAAGDGLAPGDVTGANIDGADRVPPAVVGCVCCMPGKKDVVGA